MSVQVPAPPSSKRLTQYLTDPEALRKDLGRLEALLDEINVKAEKLGGLERADQWQAEAASARQEAAELRVLAERDRAAARQQADDILAAARRAADEIAAAADVVNAEAAGRLGGVEERERVARAAQQDSEAATRAAHVEAGRAREAAMRADDQRIRYLGLIEKIKAVLAEEV